MPFLSEKYKFKKRIGKGSFGEVYLAIDVETKINVACKIEYNSNKSRLAHEYNIYKTLEKKKVVGIPKILNFIETENIKIMCIELMDRNLDDLGIVPPENLVAIARNIIDIIHQVHDAGIIHRDIKPANFCYDFSKNIRILDFGLAKKYTNKNNTHMEFTVDKPILGTLRYVGINVHLGIEPSRRDDLESIGYMFVYFAKGTLPWQGLKKQRKYTKEKYIVEKKLSVTTAKLCDDMPGCFKDFLDYTKSLHFDENPNYVLIKSMFAKHFNCEILSL